VLIGVSVSVTHAAKRDGYATVRTLGVVFPFGVIWGLNRANARHCLYRFGLSFLA
jgi:hypothetical protein